MKPKKVELTELFYDLVFVFAISKATSLIHHVEDGASFLGHFGMFAVVMIVFLNTWLIQTVYTNRYGKNSIRDIVFFMVDMALLLFMSNTFAGQLGAWFGPFVLATGLLSVTLFLQYFFVYLTTKASADKQIAQSFMLILGIRSVALLLSPLLKIEWGVFLALFGILASWLLPLRFTKVMHAHPINFPHLLERLTLITIITFGETLINIAPYFTQQTFGVPSLLIFGSVCMLFMTYITQFDHYIDEERENETGVLLIYLHYLVLFGLSLVTVSLSFIGEAHFDKQVAVNCLYIGLALFYAGILLAARYNRKNLQLTFGVVTLFILVTLGGFCLSSLNPNLLLIALIAFGVTALNSTNYIRYLIKRS